MPSRGYMLIHHTRTPITSQVMDLSRLARSFARSPSPARQLLPQPLLPSSRVPIPFTFTMRVLLPSLAPWPSRWLAASCVYLSGSDRRTWRCAPPLPRYRYPDRPARPACHAARPRRLLRPMDGFHSVMVTRKRVFSPRLLDTRTTPRLFTHAGLRRERQQKETVRPSGRR